MPSFGKWKTSCAIPAVPKWAPPCLLYTSTFAGVWQKSEVSTAALYGAKPGDAKYVDINRDGKIDKDDIGIIGNAQPKLSFGFNNTFTIFDFDLNIFWQGVSGNDIYNQNRIRRETYSSDAFPTSTVMKNHWTPENTTNIPAFSGAEYVNSSRWVEKGDYLRCLLYTSRCV